MLLCSLLESIQVMIVESDCYQEADDGLQNGKGLSVR